nr:hypothetical protein [uncultured Dyadobacter sp.]
MELSEYTFFEIHEYLKGNGDPAARAGFEQRMQQDPELAREVRLQKRIQSGLRANEFKKMLGEIHEQLHSAGALPVYPENSDGTTSDQPLQINSSKKLWPYMAAAASVVLAIGVAWLFYWSPRHRPQVAVQSDQQTPAATDSVSDVPSAAGPATKKQAAHQPLPKAQTSSPLSAETLFASYFSKPEALESPFSREKYGLSPAAVAQWRSDTAAMSRGILLLEENQAVAALEELGKLENSRYQNLKSGAAWYIALAFLRLDQREKCREQLNGIAADTTSAYREKAQRLSEQLD